MSGQSGASSLCSITSDYINIDQLSTQLRMTQQGHELTNSDIRSVQLNLPNQHVIKVDSERTRVPKEYQQQFMQVLTAYCCQNQITYKQGLNEVLAPFFHLALSKAKNSWTSQQ